MLFPEAEVTRSLSNMIKAYSVRYKEEKRLVDVAERAEALNILMAENEAKAEAAFVGGLHAIALEAQEGELPETEGEESLSDGLFTDASDVGMTPEEKAAKEAMEERELLRIKAELTEAEKMALRIEMEQEIRVQADIILEQARAQGEQVKVKAKLAAEAEKFEIFETAKKEGYEAGRLQLQQEAEQLRAEYESKERELEAIYESKIKELEPHAAQVIIGLLEGLTGVLLENRKGIVSHLISKALTEADKSESYLIKVSKEDLEEVRAAAVDLRALFEREVTLEVVQDGLLKPGECMIETDSNIIDCGLGTQLAGLKEDIRLLSIRERM